LKKTREPGELADSWDPECLYAKAQRYIQRMGESDTDEGEQALWSSLSLELLARAALTNVSPALLAETGKNWDSLYHSLRFVPTSDRFSPRSIPTNEVLSRLRTIFEDFTTENESFCVRHTGRRNSELHSGENAFEGVSPANWQPSFYSACQSLLATMGIGLEEFLGSDEANIAKKLMDAAADENAKAVKGDVAAHKKVWDAKEESERNELSAAAKAWATRQYGHRVSCPACGSVALVYGEPIAAPVQKLANDEITETQEHLPTHFECVACSLKIAGLSRLTAVGLSDRYKKTQVYDAAEFYAPEDDWAGYEEDNNEW